MTGGGGPTADLPMPVDENGRFFLGDYTTFSFSIFFGKECPSDLAASLLSLSILSLICLAAANEGLCPFFPKEEVAAKIEAIFDARSLQSSTRSLKDITIKQIRTGAKIQNKTEWKVTVTNTWFCALLQVTLRCPGFDSAVIPSSSIVSKTGPKLCLINDAYPIYGGTEFTFTYGSDRKIAFAPFSYDNVCS
ncbi:unnamed protein product [Fraxinus pennsylvanica]|uniref:Uncharacterized protein n=1 Tax=Fraxinus pennsylvanica TaxID=56036 RepID=A0AAD1YWW1_9LAMI|nr:unnamed protein product [Fraxinus pennsylvanica]